MTAEDRPITVLLDGWRAGDRTAIEQLSSVVYHELREMARRRLAAERSDHTLQPTALVHEAYLRLLQGQCELRDRVHFFATAALHMRSILVDHARSRLAEKRGGGLLRVTLSERIGEDEVNPDADLLVLDEALRSLEQEDARTARVIELTYFGGLQRDEIAESLAVSIPTVDRALRFGRAWLRRALNG